MMVQMYRIHINFFIKICFLGCSAVQKVFYYSKIVLISVQVHASFLIKFNKTKDIIIHIPHNSLNTVIKVFSIFKRDKNKYIDN